MWSTVEYSGVQWSTVEYSPKPPRVKGDFGPRWPQDGPKMAPRRPKTRLHGTNLGKKMFFIRPKAPKMPKIAPRLPQDGPKMVPRGAQEPSKIHFRGVWERFWEDFGSPNTSKIDEKHV